MDKESSQAWIAIIVVILVASGLAWAGSQNSVPAFSMPLFALCVAIAFVIQWIAFIPAWIFQTEKFYDLTGSFTYITVTLLAVFLSGNADGRTYILMALVLVWALRLGTFLFTRVLKSGKDARFDEIKVSFARFLQTWTLQGLWVSFTLAAALAAITTREPVPLGIFALVGLLVWAFGFGIEAVADQQKRRFNAYPENKGDFIDTGLWAWSRHPNYFGEITLWLGVAIITLPVLRGWQWVTLISPVFVYLLITRISGVPMLEKRADEKWGGQEDYEKYKKNTPVLVPKPPKKEE